MKDLTATQLLANRKGAYISVFDPSGANTQAVLKDLAKFCRANETTFHPDPRVHAALEGRREVWLRIKNFLDLEIDDLSQLYGAINGSSDN